MSDRLFVCGTLVPGKANEHILEEIGGTWQSATVKGTIREAGWGAQMGCPGIDLNDDGEEIDGYIFEPTKFSSHWLSLDEFEGDGYKRVRTKAWIDGKHSVDVFVYILIPD